MDVGEMPAWPRRAVLEGLPLVGYKEHPDKTWEFCPFPSCLKAALDYMGDHTGYDYLMGTTGAAFRLLWNSHEWDGGNVDLLVMAPDPHEPFRRAFAAIGYDPVMVWQGDCEEEGSFLRRIAENIDRRRPVIAFGVIGPPECCLIAGYDEGGDVLVGWNFFQGQPPFSIGVEYESSGYFRKREWFPGTYGLILIGERRETPAPDEVYRRSLQWALEVSYAPAVRQRHNGLAAYQAWAADLLRNEEFTMDDGELLGLRLMAHDDASLMVGEGRPLAAQFLRRAAAHLPAISDELLAAAELYQAEGHLIQSIWDLLGDMSRPAERVRRLARPEIRCQMAAIILQAREKDAEAIQHVARALSASI